MLQKVAGLHMHQLNRASVEHFATKHLLRELLICRVMHSDFSLQVINLFLLHSKSFRAFVARGVLQLLEPFALPSELFYDVVI